MPFPDFLNSPPPQITPDPYVFPDSFVAGDQFLFRIQNIAPHASADDWSYILALRLENAQAPISYSSTLDGDNFLIQVDATVTATWTAGRYQAQLIAVQSAAAHNTVMEVFLQVLPNLPESGSTADLRSHAKRTLDLIEALIEGRATNDILQSVIDNTHFVRMTMDQLLGAHSYYSAKVRAETAKARARAGLATGRTILTRFVQPQ